MKVGSISNGVGNQAVTYTYTVTNTSLTPIPIDQVVVTDNVCIGPTYTGGDVNGSRALRDRRGVDVHLHDDPRRAGHVRQHRLRDRPRDGSTAAPVRGPDRVWTVRADRSAAAGRGQAGAAQQERCTLSTPTAYACAPAS